MGPIMDFISIYLLPVVSIIFIVKGVELAKQIKGNEDTEENTVWVAISFTIIIYCFVWLSF
ncbi:MULTISPECIES: hypothetical protein [unclassified Bacillus (in: firmicutes)]|uniref:Uncharacterized protein n=1 Tax=Salmonella enterica subsp. enterica serovar Typhimurium var. 5- TaxID=1620419 RepID=A0A740TTD5_SALTM|nr:MULTISPECIES: hypothetical protein [unclassified Bacillus (in: firmicutes)]SFA99769.1 hypothetical protein SAMN02799634_103469 [Bacillus sp. UNCCL13]SFQ81791.1 hypothetical protein SAMN04488577_2100 [Bacillus sp. cl95]HAF0292652.1 hypothetical protein [Salmonella enterica subsp. enterica serovar Typhimurium var. 5-]